MLVTASAFFETSSLQSIFDALPGAYLILAADPPKFTILAVSDAYLRATGFTRERILRCGVAEILPPIPNRPGTRGVDELLRSLTAVLTTRQPNDMGILPAEIPVTPHPEGGSEARCWSAHNHPVIRGGTIEYLIHQIQEVPDDEEKFRKVFDEGPLGMFITTLDRYFAQANRRVCAMLGYNESELIGRRFEEITHADDLLLSTKAADALRDGKSPFLQFKKRYLRKDGSPVMVKASVSVIRDKTGLPQYYLTTIEDISQSQRLEDQIRDSEKRYRRLIETAEEGVWTIDVQGRTTFANPKMKAILGYRVDEMIGKHIFDFMTDENRVIAAVYMGRRRQGIKEHHDFCFRHKDGAEVWTRLATTPILDDQGNYAGALAMVTDITDRRQADLEMRLAREAAEAANRAKDEFLAMLSHELRTPASAILIWANLLQMGIDDPPARQAAVDTISQCAREHMQLVNDLLDTSGIRFEKVPMEMLPVNLADVVRTAVGVIRPTASAKGVHLRLDLTDAPIQGDHSHMVRVVGNLVSNALKFTPPGGHVRVHLAPEGTSAKLEVIDDGEGIADAFLPRLFHRFTQADNSSTRKHGGLGLGLSIVKSLVERHGGSVTAQSPGVGQGSTFTVTLPLASL